ncbi:hypothetical protein CLOACE_05340 [Clostridium acetireducens DSM 10703]|uniref:Uncharacterized protein n=1 Tax=Clostridium acetireducens DSM 10703 TaxID=1121290 RepID=A0A1E8F0Z8_9CLOT|nr:hypothetical protein [Clostridium acetireducens]OFI07129.1 hypothetical protein CLOACE_05340 [Clostridium acetireducens DSM 10703]
MDFDDRILQLLNNDKISKYLDEKEKNNVIREFQKYKGKYEKYKTDKNAKILSYIIFYNVINKNDTLKKKKLENSKKKIFTIKNLASILKISEKSFSKLNKEIFNKNINVQKYNNKDKNLNEFKNINKIIKKYKRNTKAPNLTKKGLIAIFKINYEYLKFLYSDKTAIKIKEYLANVYMNLSLAGYNIEYSKLEELFGEYFKYLNIVVTDGRSSKDFVKIKDIYNNENFKVYIEFMR